MVQFELVSGEYEDLPRLFLVEIPGFAGSPEFASISDHSDLAGVAVAAVGRYLVRLEKQGARPSNVESLNSIYELFERMATSRDSGVQNVLVLEAFATFECSDSIRRRILRRLGPSSRALYSRWIEPGS